MITTLRKNSLGIVFLAFVFKDVLGRLTDVLSYFWILLIFFFTIFRFSNRKFENSLRFKILVLFVVYSIINASLRFNLFYFLGVLNIILIPLFLFDRDSNNRDLKAIRWMILLLAGGGVINYFISPTIFGLIDEGVFTNIDNLQKVQFTQRAISFIRSPQSLGYVMFLGFALRNRLEVTRSEVLLVVLCGILTFSRSFYFCLILYGAFKLRRYIIPGLLIVIAITYNAVEWPGLERIVNLDILTSKFLQSKRFDSYISVLPEGIIEWIFGKGPGYYARSLEYAGIKNSMLSSESFVLQIFGEVGLIGLILILLFMFFTARKSNTVLLFIITILLSIFSPVIYGFTGALFFYLMIIVVRNESDNITSSIY